MKKDKTKQIQLMNLQAFYQAFLYQPALEFGKRDGIDAYKYIFHKPASLSCYLKIVLPSNVEVEEDEEEVIDSLTCKGINGIIKEHDFLKAEGCFTCASFKIYFCN